jgi:hypothetical protein
MTHLAVKDDTVNRFLFRELQLDNMEIAQKLIWKPKLPSNSASQVKSIIILRKSNKMIVNNMKT